MLVKYGFAYSEVKTLDCQLVFDYMLIENDAALVSSTELKEVARARNMATTAITKESQDPNKEDDMESFKIDNLVMENGGLAGLIGGA